MTHIEAPFAWGLTRGMARVLGINLVDAVSEGWFSRSDLAEMVDTCETCGEVRRCTAYLATAPRAESLPVFCDNIASKRCNLKPLAQSGFRGCVQLG